MISPNFFYWAKVCGGLNSFFIPCAVVSGFCCLIMGALLLFCGDDFEDETLKNMKKVFKTCLWVLPISILLVIIIPDTITLIEMAVAKHATVDNFESFINLLVDAIKKVKE